MRITRANARFPQWRALLSYRAMRQRAGQFVVQAVRPISLVVEFGWPVRALIGHAERPLSNWAEQMPQTAGGERVAVAPGLLGELGGKDEDTPELVVASPGDAELSRIQVGPSFLCAVFDQPSNPANIWTMARSLDAFGGGGLIVTGHTADPYDPRSVRALPGSLLTLPLVRSPSRQVLAWAERLRAQRQPPTVVGTDENGTCDVAEPGLTNLTLLVIGDETNGLSAGWRQACGTITRIPMACSASSLNVASAATVVSYEAAREHRGPTA
ncbi:TrmH family RNA methyltransferase [Nonomuraea sp. NPDC050478]|uniref:TrmH family RNA methyltransferase n=1 Tax=Nonomuraea sp. NPDC050478 TaxID=3364365 RepID=UPI0037B99625